MSLQRLLSYFYIGCSIFFAFKEDLITAILCVLLFLLMDARADIEELNKLVKVKKEDETIGR